MVKRIGLCLLLGAVLLCACYTGCLFITDQLQVKAQKSQEYLLLGHEDFCGQSRVIRRQEERCFWEGTAKIAGRAVDGLFQDFHQ